MAKFCTECGAPLQEGAAFCTSCGTPVEGQAAPQQEPAQAAPPAPQTPPPPPPVIPVQAAPSASQTPPPPPVNPPQPAPAPEKTQKQKARASKRGKCGSCGAPIRKGDDFCTQCGAPRDVIPKNKRVVIGKDGTAKLKKRWHPKRLIAVLLILAILFTGFFQPGWIYRLIYRPGKALGAEKVEVEVTSNGLVVAKGKATDGVGLPVSVRYTDAEIAAAPAQSVEVSPENPVARFDNGIIVDFGDNLSLLADEEDENCTLDDSPRTFTLRTLPTKEDAEHGCIVSGWDFDLGDIHEFTLPVKVTVPYGSKDPYTLVPQHFNEELGRWEYSAFDINEDNKTITFYLYHFSGEGLVEYPSRNAYDSSGGLNMITVDLQPAQMLQAFSADGGAEQYVNTLLARDKQSTLEWIYKASGNMGNISSGSEIGVSIHDLIFTNGKLLNGADIGLNAVGILLTGVKVYRDLLRTDSFDEAVTRNKTDLLGAAVSAAGIANTASTIYYGAGLFAASGPVLLGASALVFGFSYLDSKIKDFAFQGSDSYMAHAYETFTEERLVYIPKIRGFDWRVTDDDLKQAAAYAGGNYDALVTKNTDRLYNSMYNVSTAKGRQGAYVSIMNSIKKDYPNDPGKWSDAFDGYMTRIASYFFKNLNENTRTLLLRVYNRGNSDWWNTQTEIDNMQKDMVKKLRYELNANGDFYKKFLEDSYSEMQNQVCKAMGVQQDYLNQVLYFDLEMKNSKGENIPFSKAPQFKDKYIIFDLSGCNDKLKGSEAWAVDMDSTELFHCTLTSYLMAGQPKQLLVYDSYYDYVSKEAPVKVIPIPEVVIKTKTVNISDSGKTNQRLPGVPARVIVFGDGEAAPHNGAATTVISVTSEVPSLEEVAGYYGNGKLIIEKVDSSSSLDESLGEFGCDLNEMEGTATELPFTIENLGKNKALISSIPGEDQKNFLFSGDQATYDPDDGILKAKIIVDEKTVGVKLECTYTDAWKSGIQVTGTFTLGSGRTASITYRIYGTKPLSGGDGSEDGS